tara:strand:- start:2196 stop:2609 length:414 start_codon:yes stop_codon:yes gene_type:complete
MAFDTREFEWADITVIVGGEDLLKIRSFKLTEKIEREAIYGKGNQPVAIQSGNRSYEVELGMLQGDAEKLVLAAKGDIFSLSMDVLVNYGNPSKGDAILSKRATGFRISQYENALKQGDKFQEVTLPGLALNIQHNV